MERIADTQPAIRPGVHRVKVLESSPVTPSMRRVVVHAPSIAGLPLRPAQDVGLVFTDVEGREIRRRYTITRVDAAAQTFVLDGVLHGDGPGAAWFATASPGDEIDVVGPRGKIELADAAAWHLFVGDESGLPAFLELLRALPAGATATAVIEVASVQDEQPWTSSAAVDLRWVHRDGRSAGRADLLTAALRGLTRPQGLMPTDGPAPPDGLTQTDGLTRPDGPALPDGLTQTDGLTRPDRLTLSDGLTQTNGLTRPDRPATETGPARSTGPAQAYVLGESRAVVALNPALAALGITRAQTFVKGYWNRPRGL